MKQRKIKLTLIDRWNIFKMKRLYTKREVIIKSPDDPSKKHRKRWELGERIKKLNKEYFEPRAKTVAERLELPVGNNSPKSAHKNSFKHFMWMIEHQNKVRQSNFLLEDYWKLRRTRNQARK